MCDRILQCGAPKRDVCWLITPIELWLQDVLTTINPIVKLYLFMHQPNAIVYGSPTDIVPILNLIRPSDEPVTMNVDCPMGAFHSGAGWLSQWHRTRVAREPGRNI